GQGTGIAAIGLDLASAGGVHGGEVRVGHDDVVAQSLQAPGHPLALRRGLEEDAGGRSLPQHLGEAAWIGADPPFNQLASLGHDADLAFPLMQIDANMVHGWPPYPCATERVISLWGTLCHHVESGVSRFIPSILRAEVTCKSIRATPRSSSSILGMKF